MQSIEDNYCNVEIDDGKIIKALKVNVDNVGNRSQLSVRPERIILNPKENSENTFTGKVQELIYLGDHIRARLEVCGNSEFIVKMPNEGEVEFKEKDIINLSWLPNDIRALDYK